MVNGNELTADLNTRAAPRLAARQVAPVPAGATAPPALTPEMQARIGELRSRIQLSVGQIVLAVMNLPRYRNQSLADLSHLLIEPLLRDRVAIAHKLVPSGPVPSGLPAKAGIPAGESEGTSKRVDEESIAGVALWATVSDAVDAKITEQVKAGAFPIRLAADDWTSGNIVWLLDVIAADRQQATSVLASFRQLAGQRPVKIHPLVGRLIEPKVLEKLRGAAVNAAFPDVKGQA